MEPRRILMLANSLVGGGTERNIRIFVKFMDQHRFRPEIFTILKSDEYEKEFAAAGIHFECFERKRTMSPLYALRLSQLIARKQADLIHCFHPTMAVYASLAKRIWRTKTTMAFSAATSITPAGRIAAIYQWGIRQMDAYAANSSASRNMLLNLGIEPEVISRIPNGHEVEPFEKMVSVDVMRRSLQIDSDEKIAIYVGRLIPTKRLSDLIKAMALLPRDRYRLRLVLVGEGPEETALRTQAEESGLEDRILFLGKRHDVIDLLKMSDLFVFPSEVEGLPNAVIEAALAELPIAACDIEGVIDVVQNSQNASLVPPRSPSQFAHAIAHILDHPESAQKAAATVKKRAIQRYSVEASISAFHSFYDRILNH